MTSWVIVWGIVLLVFLVSLISYFSVLAWRRKRQIDDLLDLIRRMGGEA